jgi:hypothetical protein
MDFFGLAPFLTARATSFCRAFGSLAASAAALMDTSPLSIASTSSGAPSLTTSAAYYILLLLPNPAILASRGFLLLIV